MVGILVCLFTAAGINLTAEPVETSENDHRVIDARYEYSLKAQYLERFIRFISWPEMAIEEPRKFVIAVIGGNPFDPYLSELAAERRIKDREVEIWIIDHVAQIDGCDVLFIASSERKQLERILETTKDTAILTVSENPGFAARGVHINFFTEDQYIRFEINVKALKSAGLEPSSRLLRLARIID